MKRIQNIQLGMTQRQALELGKAHRRRFTQLISRIRNNNENDKYPHLYIYSPPGLGKTFEIKRFLTSHDVNFYEVTGNVSMFAFGIQLAVINYLNPEREPVIVFVDDTDVLFANESSCNIMKNVLSGSKTFSYEKSLASQQSSMTDLQKDAVKHFNEEGKFGFTVPTDNMTFVFASNFRLPIDDEVRVAREKSQGRSVLIAHKNAIRSRCKVGDFDISGAEQWGWIADVALNTQCLDHLNISNSSKKEIMNFLWSNWSRLTERSIRLIEKMAITMNDFPDSYEEVWEIDYLKK